MRRFIWLLSVVISIQACFSQTDKPEIVNETFEPADAELYAACVDLQGVGQFVIGKTTFKQVLSDKEFNAFATEFDRESNLFNGHWGFDFWHSMYESSTQSTGKAHWIETSSKGKVKQLYGGVTGKKLIDLEFEKFDMAFLNDTLVAIWFYPKREIEKEVIVHYKEKYGDGRGHYKYLHTRYKRGDKYYGTTDLDEARTWENEIVALEYVNKDYFCLEPNGEAKSYFTHSLLIYSKSRYPVFVETLKGLATEYDTIQKQKKDSSLDLL